MANGAAITGQMKLQRNAHEGSALPQSMKKPLRVQLLAGQDVVNTSR